MSLPEFCLLLSSDQIVDRVISSVLLLFQSSGRTRNHISLNPPSSSPNSPHQTWSTSHFNHFSFSTSLRFRFSRNFHSFSFWSTLDVINRIFISPCRNRSTPRRIKRFSSINSFPRIQFHIRTWRKGFDGKSKSYC